MRAAVSLEELRALVQTKTQKEYISCSLLSSGIPVGAITEISGHGKTEFVLKILSENKEKKVAWVEENFSVFPFGFMQRRIDLNRVLFVEAAKDLDWVCVQILRAQIFGIVVIYTEDIELNQLRRIQLASEKSGVATLWLTHMARALWPVSLQIQVSKSDQQLGAHVLRQRY
jgi:hypothetical protein